MKYSAPKGIQDILPPEISVWQRIEDTARTVFAKFGFNEIRLPIIESTDIFVRSIGEITDIVEKEMYTFRDKGDRSVTLRPEGTAGAVRCFVEHGLHNLPSPQKFYYAGPMFRYERPQKGRFRQFYQIGVEAFGVAQPTLDAEIIAMLNVFLKSIGLINLNFELNSIGCDVCRPVYKEALQLFFRDRISGFCDDCNRRYNTNILRILDCKVERCVELRSGAPAVSGHLCEHCRTHFDELTALLEALDVPFSLNANLVRGLDYYTRTTFEVTSEHLGAQKAVAAGGRYDKLVREFGGPDTPAIGFAVGMERLAALLQAGIQSEQAAPKVFVATLGKQAETEGFKIAKALRNNGLWAEPNYGGASLKSQLRKADRIGAEYALIIGENELSSGKIQWKNLKEGTQGEVALTELQVFFGRS